MKLLLASAFALVSTCAFAQPAPKIQIALDVQGAGPAAADAATKLSAEIRKGLQSTGDIDVVARGSAKRVVRVIVSAADGVVGASLLVTEQYDGPTLMMLGI